MKGQKKSKTNFKLLMVNKQVCQEASSILYEQELFFDGLKCLQHFMGQIGKCNIESLRIITVAEEIMYPSSRDIAHPACAILVQAINLESFCFYYLWGDHFDRETSLLYTVSSVSAMCHVWIEQMAKYRNDTKSWQDVFDLRWMFSEFDDNGHHSQIDRITPEFTKQEFCTMVEKYLKE